MTTTLPQGQGVEISAEEYFILKFLKDMMTLDQWIQIAKEYREINRNGGAGEISLILRPRRVPRIVTAISKELNGCIE